MNKLVIIFVFLFSCVLHAKVFNFIAIGDVPYTKPAGINMFKKMIEQINKQNPDFTIHIGDIKSGNQECEDQYYLEIKNLFNNFTNPLLYTPGDNEWVDCHRVTAGGSDSIERLNYLRRIFFAKPESLGRNKIKFISQNSDKRFSKFVENYYFEHKDGIVASVHIVGSNNNLNPANETATKEFLERQVANLSWLDKVFKKAEKAKFLILFFHAETGWGKEENKFTGYKAIYDKLVTYAGKTLTPTLLIHGDNHQFKVDHPIYFVDEKTGLFSQRPLLTRLEVYGFPDVRAIEVSVNSEAKQPFNFRALDPIEWEYKKKEQ